MLHWDLYEKNLRVDEIAALLVEVIHHGEAHVLIALAHVLLPRISKVHCAEA